MTPIAEADEPDFTLAGLSLWIHGRQFPASDDYWDGNWLVVRARVEAPGALVECSGPIIHGPELLAFCKQLKELQASLAGSARLDCMEPNLGVLVEVGWLGQVTMTVDITPDHITQSHRIRFEVDQTYLSAAAACCKALLNRVPFKGTPARRA